MERASHAVQWDSAGRPQPAIHEAGTTCFTWSYSKILIACVILLGTATPAVVGYVGAPPTVKWLCLAWLCGVAILMRGLSRRANDGAVVLSVDQRGIFDRRLMSRRIQWQEIGAIWPANTDRSHTVDIELRWPQTTLSNTRWPVRVGACCQTGYGVPAVTISMLLLDGSVSDLLDAVARHRPDLLDYTNRQTLPAAHR